MILAKSEGSKKRLLVVNFLLRFQLFNVWDGIIAIIVQVCDAPEGDATELKDFQLFEKTLIWD